ncbi:MAG TPA: hypothetical protein VM537_20385 [Anaerolineae bacterium]|nr:hypothetical protein [Anaerolineae bacterium]
MSRGTDLEKLWEGKTPKDCKVVVIQWADIRSIDRWNDSDEEVRPARRLTTPGYLLYEGIDPADPQEEIVVTAGTYDAEEETWHSFTCYPKRAFRRWFQ